MKTYKAFWLALMPFFSVAHALNCDKSYCEAVVDAGSSGTRLSIYQFEPHSFSKDTKVNLVYRNKIKKALHTLNQKTLDNSFHELFHFSSKKPIMVYFYATAGLRNLDNLHQKQIIGLVKSWFDKHADYDLKELRIIDGDEEGLFAWASTAFIEQQLNPNFHAEETGIVEIGGSSAQISFPIQQMTNRFENHVYTLSWFGKKMKIWSISLPHFGMKKAYKYMTNEAVCYSQGYPMSQGGLANGNLSSCIQSLAKIHPLNGFLKPTLSALEHQKIQNWYGFGAFAFMGNSPVLAFQNGSYQLMQLFEKADKNACQMSWQSLVKQHATLPYLDKTCLTSAYVYWFASQALDLPKKTEVIYNQPNQKDSWTLGSVVIRHMPS